MTCSRGLSTALFVLMILTGGVRPLAAAPAGQMTWGIHISLAPTWFDPAETTGIVTPFMLMYALHDAMVKPLPGSSLAPSLAESWTVAPDGRMETKWRIRDGAAWHDGTPLTVSDLLFTLQVVQDKELPNFGKVKEALAKLK